ncbi:hypothetical protein GGF43_005344, partial [Coemansia sp. RSA 2618]
MLRHGCLQRLLVTSLDIAAAARAYKAPGFRISAGSPVLTKSIFPQTHAHGLRGYSRSRYEQFKRWQQQQKQEQQQWRKQQEQQEQQRQQEQQEPEWEYRPHGRSDGRVLLLRPTLWALAFTAGTYYVCSSMFVDGQARLAKRAWRLADVLGLSPAPDADAGRIQALMSDPRVEGLVGRAHRARSASHARAIGRVARLPQWVPRELKRTLVAFADRWYALSRGTRCVYALAGVNAAVFGLWQVPRLLPFMARRFLHDPRTGLSYTLLTSTFSHRDLWHFAFNTLALVSFGPHVADAMGAEHFAAFYLSAGVASSLASHLLAPLRAARILPSLGASGAVYGVVGAAMLMFPHTRIAIIFLP